MAVYVYAHGESNPNQRNRNPSFYPLNYGRMVVFVCKGNYNFGFDKEKRVKSCLSTLLFAYLM